MAKVLKYSLFVFLMLGVYVVFFRQFDLGFIQEPKSAGGESGHGEAKKDEPAAGGTAESKLSLSNLPPVSGEPAALKGVIKFSGKPINDVIKMSADNVCVQQNGGKTIHQNALVVNPNGTLANAFIYIKEGAKKTDSEGLPTLSINQQGCMYSPHIIGVRVGQPLTITNSDPTMHNVNASSKQGQSFNLGMPKQGQTVEKKFTKPEAMIRMKCDVHGWMYAYIGVMEHPYFAISDERGNFEIPKLPAGNYIVEAWHEKLGTKSQVVSMSGKEQAVEFKF